MRFYTTRAAQTFDCAAQVGAELRYNIKIISIHRYYLPDLYIIQFLRKNFKMIPNYIMGLLLCTNAMTKKLLIFTIDVSASLRYNVEKQQIITL